eukprot:1693034-Pyramimonas_sp.AAC.1
MPEIDTSLVTAEGDSRMTTSQAGRTSATEPPHSPRPTVHERQPQAVQSDTERSPTGESVREARGRSGSQMPRRTASPWR